MASVLVRAAAAARPGSQAGSQGGSQGGGAHLTSSSSDHAGASVGRVVGAS